MRAVCIILLVIGAVSLHAQGFGKSKKKITLHRKLPHAVHLTGSTIAVKVTSRDQRGSVLAQQLHDVLETELLKNDSRLRVDAKPDATITCSITSVEIPNQPQQIQHTPLVQNNRRPSQPEITQRYAGTLNLSYQARDSKGKVLDSDNITAKYLEDFTQSGEQAAKSWKDKIKKTVDKAGAMVGMQGDEETPPTPEQLQTILVQRAAAQVAARLVTTEEQIEVYLAKGKLEDYNRYADSGLWRDWLEKLETMTPLPQRDEDAYRLYNIGVAYEALAYGAEDLKNARKFFDQAAINYGKALDAKPGEKYFLEPQNRIRTAIAHYRKLQEHEAVSGKSGRGGHEHEADETPVQSVSKGDAGAGDALTNEQLIRLAKAGLDEQNLIATIRAAKTVKFDFGVDDLVKLADNGIKGPVILAMREKAASPQAKRRTTTPHPAKK